MAGITLIERKKATKIYVTVSCRDAENKQRINKILIGEIDSNTGKSTFNIEFKSLIEQQGISLEHIESIPIKQIPKVVDFSQYLNEFIKNISDRPKGKRTFINSKETLLVRQDDFIEELHRDMQALRADNEDYEFPEDIYSSKDIGASLLLRKIVKDLKLPDIIQTSFPFYWQEILTFSYYNAMNNTISDDWSFWPDSADTYIKKPDYDYLTVDYMLNLVTPRQVDKFYELWLNNFSKADYMAIDAAAIPLYPEEDPDSDFLDELFRDPDEPVVDKSQEMNKEIIGQVDVYMSTCEINNIPIFSSPHSVSGYTESPLEYFIDLIKKFSDNINNLVIDGKYYNSATLGYLCDSFHNYKFIIPIPLTKTISRDIISNGLDKFDKNSILTFENRQYHHYSFINDFNKNIKLRYCVFFDENLYKRNEEYINEKALQLQKIAELDPQLYCKNKQYTRYLVFDKDIVSNQYTIHINHDKIKEKLSCAGWLIIATNDLKLDHKGILTAYHKKDMLEKSLRTMRVGLGLERFNIHNDESVNSKLFVETLSLIFKTYIRNILSKYPKFRRFPLDRVFWQLDRIHLMKYKDKSCIFNLNYQRIGILEAFGITLGRAPS
jgi:hypothetical protein